MLDSLIRYAGNQATAREAAAACKCSPRRVVPFPHRYAGNQATAREAAAEIDKLFTEARLRSHPMLATFFEAYAACGEGTLSPQV